jgi:Tol biopolymer transport system component
MRPLAAPAAQPLPGTQGGIHPFWSPDSRYVGFFADAKLKKIDVQGGPPVALCDASAGRGGTWNRDGVIVMQPSGSGGPLQKVSAAGGAPVNIETDIKASSPRWPYFLPDGQHLLASSGDKIFLLSLHSSHAVPLIDVLSNTVYAHGYIFYLRDDTLMAQPFDPDRPAVRGEARPIAENVRSVGNLRRGVFSVSDNGILVYQPGSGVTNSTIEWFDRDGKSTAKLGEFESSGTGYLRLSPDGKTIAFNPRHDLWLIDVERGAQSRFLTGGISAFEWAADGRSLFYRMVREGKDAIYR